MFCCLVQNQENDEELPLIHPRHPQNRSTMAKNSSAKSRTSKHKSRSKASSSGSVAAAPVPAVVAPNPVKLSKKEIDKRKKALETELKGFIKNHGWRTYKFINSDKKEHALCLKYLDQEDWDGFDDKTPEGVEARKEWIVTNGGEMAKALNSHRNDVNTALKKVFSKWQFDEQARVAANSEDSTAEPMALPGVDELEKCLNRTLNLSVQCNQVIARWYVDEVLSKAAGSPNTIWCEAQRRYETISQSGPGDEDDIVKWIHPSTEAYVVMMLQNVREMSMATFRWEQAHPGKTPKIMAKKEKSPAMIKEIEAEAKKKQNGTVVVWSDDDETKKAYGKLTPKWSKSDSGRQTWGGWDKKAIKRMAELQEINKKVRGTKKSEQWERQVLDLIREYHGITCNSKDEEGKKKRRKTKFIEDSDDEDFVELDTED